jgi:hypothetical protein
MDTKINEIRNPKYLPARSRFGEGRRNPKQARIFKNLIFKNGYASDFEIGILGFVSPACRRQGFRCSNFGFTLRLEE